VADSQRRRSLSGTPGLLLGALLAWAAVIIPIVIGGVVTDARFTTGELGGAALFCLGAVLVPCLLALAAARPGGARRGVLVVLTLASLAAGIVIAVSEDAQAGVVVLLVSVLAIGLAIVFGLARLLTSRKS
jgi:hypothetical protein